VAFGPACGTASPACSGPHRLCTTISVMSWRRAGPRQHAHDMGAPHSAHRVCGGRANRQRKLALYRAAKSSGSSLNTGTGPSGFDMMPGLLLGGPMSRGLYQVYYNMMSQSTELEATTAH
jgi:hypothetical protein